VLSGWTIVGIWYVLLLRSPFIPESGSAMVVGGFCVDSLTAFLLEIDPLRGIKGSHEPPTSTIR
jgi:hypothetical protein